MCSKNIFFILGVCVGLPQNLGFDFSVRILSQARNCQAITVGQWDTGLRWMLHDLLLLLLVPGGVHHVGERVTEADDGVEAITNVLADVVGKGEPVSLLNH